MQKQIEFFKRKVQKNRILVLTKIAVYGILFFVAGMSPHDGKTLVWLNGRAADL